MLVTISGLPGSGTSTLAAKVAVRLGVERVDGGSMFRAMAAERGLNVAEFSALAENDTAFDLELDTRLADRATRGDLVLESRLAAWIVMNAGLDATRIWVECDPVERARRVAERERTSLEDALRANAVREESERLRYLEYYGIDIAIRSIYDLVLDSTLKSPSSLVRRAVAAARR